MSTVVTERKNCMVNGQDLLITMWMDRTRLTASFTLLMVKVTSCDSQCLTVHDNITLATNEGYTHTQLMASFALLMVILFLQNCNIYPSAVASVVSTGCLGT